MGPKSGRRGGDAADDFGSLDSSDTTTYLSCCNTHPFPSQGSLVGLEALAAQGSMAANGSINNSLYVNPFDPPGRNGAHNGRHRRAQTPPPSSKAVMTTTSASSTTSPRGSPQRRVRIVAAGAHIASISRRRRRHSRSIDLCGEDNFDGDDDLGLMEREAGTKEEHYEDCWPPKHRRARKSQSGSREQNQPYSASWRVTTKIAAALNLGLSSLGEKLGKGGKNSPAPGEPLIGSPPPSASTASESASRRKSILKHSDSSAPLPPRSRAASSTIVINDSETDFLLPSLLSSLGDDDIFNRRRCHPPGRRNGAADQHKRRSVEGDLYGVLSSSPQPLMIPHSASLASPILGGGRRLPPPAPSTSGLCLTASMDDCRSSSSREETPLLLRRQQRRQGGVEGGRKGEAAESSARPSSGSSCSSGGASSRLPPASRPHGRHRLTHTNGPTATRDTEEPLLTPDEGADAVDLYEDDELEEQEEGEDGVLQANTTTLLETTTGGTVRRSKFARGREHWHRDHQQHQQLTVGLEQLAHQQADGTPQQQQQLFIKEQQLHSGEQRVSQDDSGIGVGTSLEVLAGLAATTPSPTQQ